MSDNITREQPDARPFEERVISILNDLRSDMNDLRSDMNTRFDSLDERVRALEAKNYDTKPIWERALAEILKMSQEQARMNQELARFNDEQVHIGAEQVRIAEEQTKIHYELKEAVVRMDRLFRVTQQKVDIFTQELLDDRYRLQQIEDVLKIER